MEELNPTQLPRNRTGPDVLVRCSCSCIKTKEVRFQCLKHPMKQLWSGKDSLAPSEACSRLPRPVFVLLPAGLSVSQRAISNQPAKPRGNLKSSLGMRSSSLRSEGAVGLIVEAGGLFSVHLNKGLRASARLALRGSARLGLPLRGSARPGLFST